MKSINNGAAQRIIQRHVAVFLSKADIRYMVWWIVMIAIGVWMAVGGFTQSSATPFKYLVARAELLWKSRAHNFLGISGVVVALVGAFFLLSG